MRASRASAKEESAWKASVDAASVDGQHGMRETDSAANTHKPARARVDIDIDTNTTMARSASLDRTVRTSRNKKGTRHSMTGGEDEVGYGNRGDEEQRDGTRKRSDRVLDRPRSRSTSSSSSGSAKGCTPPVAGGKRGSEPSSESDKDTRTPLSTLKVRRIIAEDDD